MFGTAMFAGIPFAFGFDTGAVHCPSGYCEAMPERNRKVQRPTAATIRQAHVQSTLVAAQGAEVWDRPIQTNERKQALHEPGCLPERHPEEHLQGQTGLDCGIAELLMSTGFAIRWRHPDNLGIEPA